MATEGMVMDMATAMARKFFDIFRKRKSILSSDVLRGREDRHSHILFGVDDGLKNLEDSLEVLAYLETVGISDLWCTPHIMEDVPNSTEALKNRFAELQNAYKGPVRLHLAAEYMLDTVFAQRLQDRDLLTMDDDVVLVETSVWNPPTEFYAMLEDIKRAGYHPLLAHPERYRYLRDKDYGKLYSMGVAFQLNLGSLVGYYGETAETKAKMILAKGWYSHIGSDCHRLATLKDQYNRDSLTSDIVNTLNDFNLHTHTL